MLPNLSWSHMPTHVPQVISYSHIHPGMPMTVTIASIEDYGMLVSAGPGVKGLVPRLHASDLGTAKAMLKFKVSVRTESVGINL